jgi:fructokinase
MFLVCGEAVIDFFQARSADLAFAAQPAGSPFNVAIGLKRLGAGASLMTGLSTDPFGRQLIAALEAEGVAWDLAVRTDRPTILSFVMVKPDGGPEYAFYGENGADLAVPAGAIRWPLPPEIRAIHVGGFPMAVEPAKGSYATLIDQGQDSLFISVDPNVRPSLMGDLGAFRAHFESLCGKTALVKASTEDLHHLYAGASITEVATRWRTLGLRTAVITDGPNGACCLNDAGETRVPTAPVTVVDTVGAGDSFMAALLAEIAARDLLDAGRLAAAGTETIAPILAFANRAAGITCTRRGANPPTRAEMAAS